MRGRIVWLGAILSLAIVAPAARADGLDAPAAAASKLPAKFRELADVKLEVVPAKAKWGETVTVRLTIEIKPGLGGHTYPFFPKKYPEQKYKNTLALPAPSDPVAGGLIYLPLVNEPTPEEIQRKKAATGVMDQYYGSTVTWEFKAVVSPRASAGSKQVGIGDDTRIQVCNDEACVPVFGDKLPKAPFDVVEGASDRVVPQDLETALSILAGQSPAAAILTKPPVPDATREDHGLPPAPAAGVATQAIPTVMGSHGNKQSKPLDSYKAELSEIQNGIVKTDLDTGINGSPLDKSLASFVLTAALWGLISLVTPCVFPMIPITVSIFLKHAHGSLRERLKLAGVYCLTIITVLGVSAFALLKFMAWLSTNPVTNILLGLLFLVLALSLFGMYELTLPAFLSRRLQAKQAKGGVMGTIFGALAFTVISFTCVAPFLGGFAGISSADAGGNLVAMPTTREIAGGLAFATAFAAPFFILALIPGLLKSLPRSGGWLDSVKVVMGFLELAAALKFLRTAEVRLFSPTQYFTYDLVLGGWIAISVACGLYLLNAYRLPHDEEKPNIGVMRLLFALLFLALGFYLLPAMFKASDGKPQRPSGAIYAWIEAFLLPEAASEGTDLKTALDEARKTNQPVFLDFTGKTCTNCKYNENEVFTRPEIRALLGKYEKVQLYTDEVPGSAYAADPGYKARVSEAKANGDFQQAAFGDIALPLYAVLVPQPDGKIKLLGTREGKINDPADFAAWLQSSLEEAKKR